jgi:putative ABC transport system permease protein
LTRAELYSREADYWVGRTATGAIFSFGVGVTLLVAVVVVYQVLSNDVRNRLPEYATLKAMGFRDSSLGGIVVAQALIYACLAFVPASLIATGVYALTERLAGIPMVLTAQNLAMVFGLTGLAGLVSGWLTVGKLRAANPADLF